METRLAIRLSLPIAVVSILLMTLGVLAAWYVHRLQSNTTLLLSHDVASIRAAEEVAIGIRDIRFRLSQFLLDGNRHELDGIPALYKESEHWLGIAERLANTPQEQDLIRQVRRGFNTFLADFKNIGSASEDDVNRMVNRLNEVIEPDILTPAHQYLDLNEEVVEAASVQNQLASRREAWGLLLLGACGSVGGILTGVSLARGVRRSIVQLHVPIRDASGRLAEVVGPLGVAAPADFENLDATLRSLAEQVGTVVDRLQQSQYEVLRAEQLAALGQLAAGMAHELRNPLTAIKILIQSAARPDGAGTLSGRDLSVLEQEMTRLEQAIQSFLDYARPPRLEKCVVDVRDVTRQVLELVTPRAQQQRVELSYTPPTTAARMLADPQQLRQVLLNLVLNSLDVLRQGGRICVDVGGGRNGLVEQHANAAKSHGDWITMRVTDNGPGLPADLGERIFQPYVSTKDAGLGLGLAICRRIVEAHGGQIAAESAAGEETTFTIRLPAVDGAAENVLTASTRGAE